nr:ribonuclease H-like domain-containing protein [Tanacetum cinerariifolium]
MLGIDMHYHLTVVDDAIQAIAPTTAEQRLAKKNELKARGTLLMALLDKHQLKFNIHKDAKSLIEAIEKRFGGNKETKKVQKTLLKQQYENFSGSSSESLDQIHDRLQKRISQLEILAEVKSSSSTSHNTQNIAFVSSNNTHNTNKTVSAVPGVFAASTKAPVSTLPNVDNLSDAEMDLKWQMAMLTMRARRFLQRTGRNLCANGTTSIGFDMPKADEELTNYALMAFTSSSSSSSDNEVAPCTKACSKAYATLQSHYDKLTVDFRKSQFDFLSYKSGLESVEARLVVYQQYENVFEEDIKLLKLDVMLRDNALVELRKKFEKAEKERDEVIDYDDLTSSESDDSVSTSPVHDRYKSGEGYHVVPPSYTRAFMPPKPDLVLHDAPTASETVPNVFYVEPSTTKPNKDMTSIKQVEHTTQVENFRKDIPKSRGYKHSWNRKACFVCKSLNHLIKDCDFYENQMVQKPVRKHAMRVNHLSSTRMTHPHSNKHVVPTAVLTRSRLVPLSAARPVTTAVSQTTMKNQRPAKHVVNKPHSPIRRPINHRPAPTNSIFYQKVTTVKTKQVNVVQGTKGNWGNLQQALKDKGVIDNGCSRHMTGNISYLSDFEEINGGYVSFVGNLKGGKITGKGKIKTGKIDFDDVYFFKELKFNLFSVSQMYDKKNSVLFTDTECVVLSSNFTLPDENHMLLRVPRENNMYNVDLKNIVPSGDLTCLFAKATLDESNLWHRRLGHINFKTMNKLVKGNLVRGLPLKVFKNNHTCVSYKKGKQHRASCKTKPVSSVSQPLQRLHMDLFGPTFVKSLNKKSYYLVVIDDYSRVLVTKPYNKTPYELLLGRTPSIGFMRPFRCPITILNTLDPLGKFNGKADEGFLVRYSVISKAFRVFNSRTRIVQETLHINFLENQPNVAGSGPKWLFDIDTLTQSMNYQLVVAGNQPSHNAGIQGNFDAGKVVKEDESAQQYVLLPLCTNRVNAASAPVTAVGPNSTNSTNNFNNVGPSDNVSDDEEDVGAVADFFNLETSITVSPIPTTNVHKDHPVTQIIGDLTSVPQTRSMARMVKEQGGLNQINDEDFYTCMFACFLS